MRYLIPAALLGLAGCAHFGPPRDPPHIEAPPHYAVVESKPKLPFADGAAQSLALVSGRDYVIPEDVRSISRDVLRHRIGLTYEAEAENVNVEQVIDDVLKVIPVP